MDDNKKIEGENQRQNPIFESIPVEEVSPEVESPFSEEIASSSSPPATDFPPPVYEENKQKYFIIAGVVTVFFIFLLVILKLIFGGKPSAKKVSLTYWGLWEDSQVFEPLIEQYHKNNPHVTVVYQKMDPHNYREKLIARSKNGQGPDIFRFHNTWLPEIKEIAAPLPSNIMSNSEFEKTFYKIHQKDLKIGNYYYGLPLEIDGLVLIYNDSLFKKAGIISPPTTWDELTDTVAKLTVKNKSGQIITAGIAIGTTGNIDHFSDIFGLMLAQNSGEISKLDQPEAAGALESYRKFAEPPNSFWDENMPQSTLAFVQEKVAMIIAPSWQAIVIKTANPDINLKIAPVPTIPGLPPVSLANYWVEGVSRFSRNQIEAWKFLRFLVEKDNLTKLYEIQSKLRLFGEPYSRVDLAPLLSQNPYVGPVIKQADYYVSFPLVSRTYDNGLNDEIIKYIEDAINATTQGVSYNEALKTAKQGVDQVFTKFRLE
ncbi:MAG: ABC transporter substrate-binding protein [Microgenomates group bacterium]